MITRRAFVSGLPLGAAALAAAPAAPAPHGALPSVRQLLWHGLEVYAFLHFTVNTFTDKEWGYGDESPSIFDPAQFDADAIVEALAAGGMRGVILTAKHHDGFCLWPTKTTGHSVKASKWRNGQGDVVRLVAEAARRRGLGFGVYLSPWDRNNPHYARPEYVQIYRTQLRELLTGYGKIFEVWHDGANGGDGYYGGAREKRQIDKHTYYGWPETWEMVRTLQPDAVVFSDVGPDLRWVGNESGYANETCWATYDPVGEDGGPPAPGYTRYKEAGTGHRNGSKWLPAECDVSIRKGWFWHQSEDATVKTPRQLFDLYFKSVGRGTSFLLNVPPDRRGLVGDRDATSLQGFGKLLRTTFDRNLAGAAKISASNTRGSADAFAPRNLLDGTAGTFWAADDRVLTPEAVLDFGREITFDVIRLREYLRLGQRVDAFAVDTWTGTEWKEVAQGTSVGSCRLVRTPSPVTSARVRLRITRAAASPAISEFGLFRAPEGA